MSSETNTVLDESFAEYAAQRHQERKSVAVFVEGDFGQDPPLGNSAMARVAHFLAGEDDVVAMEPGKVTDESEQSVDNLGAIQVTLKPRATESEWRPVQRRLLSRVPRDTDVVVLVDTSEVPWFMNELCDVRVVPNSEGGELTFYRVHLNPYEGDVYYTELNGFHGDSNGN